MARPAKLQMFLPRSISIVATLITRSLGRTLSAAPSDRHAEGASDDTTCLVARNLSVSEDDISAALRG